VASARRIWKSAAVLAAVAAIALIAIPAALAAFGGKTQNEGDFVTAAADFTPPAITAAAIGKTVGGATGFIKQGGTYYVYATVATDTGNPASGIASVTANVTTVTVGQTSVALVAGSYPAGSVTYNYRSAALTAAAVLSEGTKAFTVTATDKAGNAKTFSAGVTVDNTPPKAADIQSANGGATVGRAEEKDSITYTFSEPVEPESILAGWNGSATNVVVRMVDNGLLGLAAGNDELIVNNAANTAALPLGTVNMGSGEYVTSLLGGGLGGSIFFGATGTASSMTMSGNTVTITLGTYSAESILVGRITATTAGSMIWTPVATPFDRAANPMSAGPVTQSGGAKKEF
jgi:hypothetical protein